MSRRIGYEGFLRGDAAARAQLYRELYYLGAINQDEIRAFENMNPLPNGQGKHYFVQANMVPLASVVPDEPIEPTADRTIAPRLITAHRALLLDAMNRIVSLEEGRVQRMGIRKEALQACAEFIEHDVVHESKCVEILKPAIEAHLAMFNSTRDPVDVAKALVKVHVSEVARQLRVVSSSDDIEATALLRTMFDRWRLLPDQFADQMVHAEIAHVRGSRLAEAPSPSPGSCPKTIAEAQLELQRMRQPSQAEMDAMVARQKATVRRMREEARKRRERTASGN